MVVPRLPAARPGGHPWWRPAGRAEGLRADGCEGASVPRGERPGSMRRLRHRALIGRVVQRPGAPRVRVTEADPDQPALPVRVPGQDLHVAGDGRVDLDHFTVDGGV